MKLQANTYQGLVWGLTNFDGIETDLRLTKDEKIVIFHDAYLETGEMLADLTLDELEEKGVPSLEKFFNLPHVIELSASKKIYLELKPNCDRRTRISSEIATVFYDSFQKLMKNTQVEVKSIHIISFSEELLEPFVDKYPCFPLLPDVNECSDRFIVIKAMPQVLGRSLSREMKEAEKRGYAGIFFARQYVMGWTSWRHPSYDDAVKLANSMNMLLGTNLGTPELEDQYPDFARFSDKLAEYPRYSKDGEGPIIAHRGTGTKGVEVAVEDVPQLSL